MKALKPLCKTFKILLLLSLCLNAKDLETFYQQIHFQAMEKNYVRFNSKNLLSYQSYQQLNKNEKESLSGSLILVFSTIARFIYLNEQSGVGIATPLGSYLQFNHKYYETLEDIG
ncbi:MAG: hypothetical protein K2I63_04440, partial [Helicobacter sp.]|nr:hypothetical protein [Helicobacter sp.]